MYRSIRFIALTVLVMALAATMAFGQIPAPISIPIFVSGVAAEDTGTVVVGWNDGPPPSTYAPDLSPTMGAYMEFLAPPVPPGGAAWWVGFYDAPSRAPANPIATVSSGTGMMPLNFVGFNPGVVDSFQIRVTGNDVPNGNVSISWPAGLSAKLENARLLKRVGAAWNVVVPNMLTSTTYLEDNTLGGGTFNYLLIAQPKVLVDGPLASLSAATNPLNFGTVQTGASLDLPITLSNGGSVNTLNVTAVSVTGPYTIVSPATPFSVGPLASQAITVRFSPVVAGVATGVVTVTDNSTSGPTQTYNVTGNGLSQGGVFTFNNLAPVVLDNSTGIYTDTLKISSYAGLPLKAIQFTMTTNGKIVAGQLKKVGQFDNANWSLSVQPTRGVPQADGTSTDVWKVVVYSNGSAEFVPSAAPADVLSFAYDVVNITVDQASTTVVLSDIIGSTGTAADAGLNAGATQTITINNRTILGDINKDDRVDILDLLLIVDHITGKRIIPNPSVAFTAANLAPWGNIDGVVNVLDLVLLQNIILDGHYPDNSPLYKTTQAPLAGLAKGSAVKALVTVYAYDKGIAVRIKNDVVVRGAQIIIKNALRPTAVTSKVFGASVGQLNGNSLNVLVYSNPNADLAIGESYLVNIASVGKLENLSIESIVVGGENGEVSAAAEILYKAPPADVAGLITDFALMQNYPNPFNPETRIQVSMKEAGPVRVTIYNMLGQEVRTLFAGQMEAGVQTLSFNGKDASGRSLSTGTYIYRMVAGSFVETKKMLLMK